MKRKIEAYLELSIRTDSDHNEIAPLRTDYTVLVNGEKELPFSFRISNTEVNRIGKDVIITEKQHTLDKQALVGLWIKKGFIAGVTPEDEIESIIFDLIRKSDSIKKIDIKIYEQYGYPVDGKISQNAFTIVESWESCRS